jgi:hypothetical protein
MSLLLQALLSPVVLKIWDQLRQVFLRMEEDMVPVEVLLISLLLRMFQLILDKDLHHLIHLL